MRLSSTTELRDVLNVLAAGRRELWLTLRTDRPLRKPRTRTQKRQVARLRSEATEQIIGQMDVSARRAFRGRIAVELRLRVPAVRHDAALAPIVKDYLDLLRGPVVPDDARVDHLLVLRNPVTVSKTEVEVRCLPLSIFEAEYDRAFRVLGEHGAIAAVAPAARPDDDELERPFLNAAPNPRYRRGLSRFDEWDKELLLENERMLRLLDDIDAEVEEQLLDDPDADIDLDLPSTYLEFEDADVRASTREYLEPAVAFARGDWLTDQGFDARDRPGPPPAWLSETIERDAADVLQLADPGPGCFRFVPPPEYRIAPGEPTWEQAMVNEIYSKARTGPWHRIRFRGPLALDIALRGRAGRRNDVDNVAHAVMRALAAAFGQHALDIAGYRAYRQRAPDDEVRVRLMPLIRLQALASAMDDARAIVRAERSERIRD